MTPARGRSRSHSRSRACVTPTTTSSPAIFRCSGSRCSAATRALAHSAWPGLTLLQKKLQGSIFGHGNPQYDIPMLLSLYQAGKLNLDDMVTREYTLEQINDGYRDMLEGRNIRGIIRFTDADR